MYNLTASHLIMEGDTGVLKISISPKLLVVLLLGLLKHHVALLVLAAQPSCSIVGSTLWALSG